MSTDKDFLDLLSSLAEEQQYTIELSRQEEEPIPVKFKSLTTVQLKELVKTAVDSPLTQSVFNSTATKIFKDSVLSAPIDLQFNVVDRLLFLLETRIQTISPTKTIKNEDKEVEVNYNNIIDSLKKSIKKSINLFAPAVSKANKVSITYGVSLIDTDVQLEEEIYKNVEVKIENVEELRKIVGEAFINEIAKAIHAVSIEDKTINLKDVSFKKRLKIVETLPASLIQNVVEYIESYKNVLTGCLTVKDYTIPIDSTLFSV
jgi:macrodomain Ter protein organizer (MatP/YcbG family)